MSPIDAPTFIVDVLGHRAGRVDVADEPAERVVVEAFGACKPQGRPRQHGSNRDPADNPQGAPLVSIVASPTPHEA